MLLLWQEGGLQMSNLVLWPWEPNDEEIAILVALHSSSVEVLGYDSGPLESDELSLVLFAKENPSCTIYVPGYCIAVQILAAALAGVSFRIIEQDDEGDVTFIYEYLPRPREVDPYAIPISLRRVWPQVSLEKIRQALPHLH